MKMPKRSLLSLLALAVIGVGIALVGKALGGQSSGSPIHLGNWFSGRSGSPRRPDGSVPDRCR